MCAKAAHISAQPNTLVLTSLFKAKPITPSNKKIGIIYLKYHRLTSLHKGTHTANSNTIKNSV